MLALIITALLTQGWEVSVDAGLNLSQSYYNNAWSGDEVGSIVWMGLFNLEAKKAISSKLQFSEIVRLGYGQTYAQNKETGEWQPPQKSTDKIESESIFMLTMGWLVEPFVSLLIRSQFIDNENNLFINPIEFTESFGLARTLWKSNGDELTSRTGLAFKHNADRSEERKTSYEGGLEVVINAKKKLSKVALYQGKLILFKALFNSEADTTDTWKTPDFNFQNTVGISLTKYLQLNLYLELIYDKDITPTVQIKENFSIGLSYKFF